MVDVVVVGGLGRGGGLQHVSDRDKQIPGQIWRFLNNRFRKKNTSQNQKRYLSLQKLSI